MQDKIKKLINAVKRHRVDLILFGMSGTLAFIADFTTLQLVDKLSHQLILATTSGVLVGFIVSYALNQLRFSRRHDSARSAKQSFPLFVALFVFNSTFTFLCLSYNDRHQIAPRVIIKMGTVGFIMVWNYILFHIFVFREKPKQSQ